MKSSALQSTRKQLRRELRARRKSLTSPQQKQAALQLVKRLRAHPVFLRSKRVAFYMAEDGEINLSPLIECAQKMGKTCYLPILHPLKHNTLWFGRYRKGDELLRNYFDLSEPPAEGVTIKPWALDLVLMPLVGFDRQGNRLGMGGGFYDRTFAFRNRNKPILRSPALMGIAHHCQETHELTREVWDVPLDYVATDKEVITAR